MCCVVCCAVCSVCCVMLCAAAGRHGAAFVTVCCCYRHLLTVSSFEDHVNCGVIRSWNIVQLQSV